MTPVEELLGIGPASSSWLHEVGIFTREDLETIGPVAAFMLVQRTGIDPSLNLLWVLAACLEDLHWTKLPAETKQALLEELRSSTDE